MADEAAKASEWVKLIREAFELIGFKEVPNYVGIPVGIFIFIAVLVLISAAAFIALGKIKDVWTKKLRPLSYSPEEKRRAAAHRQFANHILRELNQRNLSENWRDEEFAELEAEVEAEGSRHSLIPALAYLRIGTGIRREPSLTRALERSTERLVLLEGDPGSGKSVALRHVTQKLANRASTSRWTGSTIPIFVNLKELTRDTTLPVNRELIRGFILRSMNRINDRFVDEFLDQEFDQGIRDGRWLFLFDSFDEIPDVLSSTDADQVIQSYSDAISDFLSGINECRAIVASRNYRGPSHAGWRKFRILELSESRQRELVSNALLKPPIAEGLRTGLALAPDDIQAMARNPLFLGLLCEHMRMGHDFPFIAHEVFEKYFDYRFQRDAARVLKRFELTSTQLRRFAEQAAFAIASNPELGLTPPRRLLAREVGATQGGPTTVNKIMDALEYMKIGRGDRDGVAQEERQFTFSHRRFQEYFATCVVVLDPDVVRPYQLLTDARWRETAVVLLQTGGPNAITPLLTEALRLLDEANAFSEVTNPPDDRQVNDKEFPWPRGALHLMGILQAGFMSNATAIPQSLRESAAKLIMKGTNSGSLLDRKYALEVAGIVPEPRLVELLRAALQIDSQWLNDIVYRQIARLSKIPDDLRFWVRTAILRIALGRGAQNRRTALHAHISRLSNSEELIRPLRMAFAIRTIDLLAISIAVALLKILSPNTPLWIIFCVWALSVYVCHYAYWSLYHLKIRSLVSLYRLYLILYLCMVAMIPPPWPEKILWQHFNPPMFSVFCLLIILYFFAWPFGAICCVQENKFTQLLRWPLAPVELIRHLYKELKRRLPSLIETLHMVGVMVAAVGIFGGVAYLITNLDERMRWIVFAIVTLLMLTPAAISVLALAFDSWKDYNQLRVLKERPRAELNVAALVRVHNNLRLGIFKYLLWSFVRKLGLAISVADRTALESLASESTRKQSTRLRLSWRAAPRFIMRMLEFESERRDEIYRILEEALRR